MRRCPGGLKTRPIALIGYWVKPDLDACLATAERDGCFLSCLPSASQCAGGEVFEEQCTGHFEGELCARCGDGRYRVDERCDDCDGWTPVWIALLVVLILVPLLGVLWAARLGLGASLLTGVAFMINYCQTLAVLRTYRVRWPRPFNELLELFSVFGFKVTLFRVECVGTYNVYSRNLTVFSAPVCIVLLYTAIGFLLKLRSPGNFDRWEMLLKRSTITMCRHRWSP